MEHNFGITCTSMLSALQQRVAFVLYTDELVSRSCWSAARPDRSYWWDTWHGNWFAVGPKACVGLRSKVYKQLVPWKQDGVSQPGSDGRAQRHAALPIQLLKQQQDQQDGQQKQQIEAQVEAQRQQRQQLQQRQQQQQQQEDSDREDDGEEGGGDGEVSEEEWFDDGQ